MRGDPKLKPDHIILIDFDLTANSNVEGRLITSGSSRRRTGTIPFMALDLLENISIPPEPGEQYTHFLRHDLESVLYVAFWVAVKFRIDDEDTRLVLDGWERGETKTILEAKRNAIASTWDKGLGRYPLAPQFSIYRPWLERFAKVISNGYRALEDHKTGKNFHEQDKEFDELLRGHLNKCTENSPVIEMETINGSITLKSIEDVLRKRVAVLRKKVAGFKSPC